MLLLQLLSGQKLRCVDYGALSDGVSLGDGCATSVIHLASYVSATSCLFLPIPTDSVEYDRMRLPHSSGSSTCDHLKITAVELCVCALPPEQSCHSVADLCNFLLSPQAPLDSVIRMDLSEMDGVNIWLLQRLSQIGNFSASTTPERASRFFSAEHRIATVCVPTHSSHEF